MSLGSTTTSPQECCRATDSPLSPSHASRPAPPAVPPRVLDGDSQSRPRHHRHHGALSPPEAPPAGSAVIRIWFIRPYGEAGLHGRTGIGQVHVHLGHGPITHDHHAVTQD